MEQLFPLRTIGRTLQYYRETNKETRQAWAETSSSGTVGTAVAQALSKLKVSWTQDNFQQIATQAHSVTDEDNTPLPWDNVLTTTHYACHFWDGVKTDTLIFGAATALFSLMLAKLKWKPDSRLFSHPQAPRVLAGLAITSCLISGASYLRLKSLEQQGVFYSLCQRGPMTSTGLLYSPYWKKPLRDVCPNQTFFRLPTIPASK